MNYNSIEKIIMDKLKKELPSHLSYHTVGHVQDVIRMSEQIALSENIDNEGILLLKTAALFHDTGFIQGATEHEQRSCNLAQEYLPSYGYTQEQIDRIKGMIMATKLPQSPQNHLEKILADADLDYLGRDDFFKISDKLFHELKTTGMIASEREWNLLQEKFMENHNYFTGTSIRSRSLKKQENLNKVKSKL